MESLLCNTLKCRKTLSFENVAVVTSCSHIFCVDCANAFLGSSPPSCHICHAKLEDNYDLVQAELNPADLWKSLILAGLPPPVIIDIASRALSFWNYQQDHEKLYQTVLANHAEKRVGVLEKELTEWKRKNEADNEYWRAQITNLGRDLEVEKRKTQQCRELNSVNSKAYAKLKATNEQLKQQILLGTNPMSNANLYSEAPLASPAATNAAYASRIPFVPVNSAAARPHSSAIAKPPMHLHHHENVYHDPTSARPYLSNHSQLQHVTDHASLAGQTLSRSKDRPSSDGDVRARVHAQTLSRSPSRSRSKGRESFSVQSVAQGMGEVSLNSRPGFDGGGGGGGGQSDFPSSQTSTAHRSASTVTTSATRYAPQSFFNHKLGPIVAGSNAVRPVNLEGRAGSN